MSVLITGKFQGDTAKFRQALTGRAGEFAKISDMARAEGGLHHRFGIGDGFVVMVDEWETAEHFQRFFANPELQAFIGSIGAAPVPPGDHHYRGHQLPRPVLRRAAVSAEDNIKTITQVYEAFGRGDVAAILAEVSDNVDWAAEAASADAPWYGVRHGRDGVAAFFTEFGSTMEVEEFTPVSIAASDDDVLTVVRFRARSRGTGKTAAMDLHHFFRFRDGKIAYYRGTEDTAQTAQVLQP